MVWPMTDGGFQRYTVVRLVNGGASMDVRLQNGVTIFNMVYGGSRLSMLEVVVFIMG